MKVTLFVLVLFHSFSSIAQQTLASSGGNFIGSTSQMSFTVGEAFYEIKGNSKDGLQQGFVVNRIAIYSSLHLSVYPNPTADFLYFKVEDMNYENLHYRIIDFTGILLASGEIQADSRISLQHIPSQTLFLQCYRNAYEQVIYKVIKLN